MTDEAINTEFTRWHRIASENLISGVERSDLKNLEDAVHIAHIAAQHVNTIAERVLVDGFIKTTEGVIEALQKQ